MSKIYDTILYNEKRIGIELVLWMFSVRRKVQIYWFKCVLLYTNIYDRVKGICVNNKQKFSLRLKQNRVVKEGCNILLVLTGYLLSQIAVYRAIFLSG